MDHLDYTPVNEETFGAWCEGFMALLKEQDDKIKSETDNRPTGRELF